MTGPILAVRNLSLIFEHITPPVAALQDVSFEINAGEVVGLVGESGCGKSATALSILRLIVPPGRIVNGQILFQGRDILAMSDRELRSIRGNRISIVFQEPYTALNPVMQIGTQIAEVLQVHQGLDRRSAWNEAANLLDAVRIPAAARRVRDYPHQLSGGMRQRALIAMAIACRPELLIADEPTTSVDVSLQSQILDLLDSLRRELRLSVLFITHSMGVLARIADRVLVMYAGRIVEQAPVRHIFHAPRHPYTVGLLNSIPKINLDGADARLKTIGGSVPDLTRLPAGCSFEQRCPERMEICAGELPQIVSVAPNHTVACHKHTYGTLK